MLDNIGSSLRKNWSEKLLLFTIVSCLTVVTVLFGLFQAQTVPNANGLNPIKCHYNRDRYYAMIQPTHSGLSILSESNISIQVEYPFFTNPTLSLWIRDRDQIWMLDAQNGLIYVSQTINNKIIYLIPLLIVGCGGPYNWSYNQQAYVNPITRKLSGQVWVTCESSNNVIIIDTHSYSVIGQIPTPGFIIGTNYPSSVVVGPKYAFVVYYPNVWFAYSTTPPFAIIKTGQTPGSNSAAITTVWRGNDNHNNADLYLTTSIPQLVKIGWNQDFEVQNIQNLPYTVQAITTSLNEVYLYVIFQNRPILYIYETDGLNRVGSSNTYSVIQSKPNSFAIGRRNEEMIVTDYSSVNIVLMKMNPDTGVPVNSPPIFIFSGNGTASSIRYVQDCSCHYC